jgi:hypothetical protein
MSDVCNDLITSLLRLRQITSLLPPERGSASLSEPTQLWHQPLQRAPPGSMCEELAGASRTWLVPRGNRIGFGGTANYWVQKLHFVQIGLDTNTTFVQNLVGDREDWSKNVAWRLHNKRIGLVPPGGWGHLETGSSRGSGGSIGG